MGRDKYFVDAMASLKLRYKISYLIVRGNQSKPVSYSSDCKLDAIVIITLLALFDIILFTTMPDQALGIRRYVPYC